MSVSFMEDEMAGGGAECKAERSRTPACVMLDVTRNAWHHTQMEIESIRHKALRKMAETGKARGVIEPKRIARMLTFLLAVDGINELELPPNFGFHALSGDREGTYAMTVTKNWRLTFTLTERETLADLDLEDFH